MIKAKIYLALSCLQGRPMKFSAAELLNLKPYGLQLTPGNVPTKNFENWLNENKINYIFHHGFSWFALRQKVWDENGNCLVNSNSVHPPEKKNLMYEKWIKVLENDKVPVLETMYPEYYLGNGLEIEIAMKLNISLAVDISHIYIQKCNDLISEKIWKKLQNYENIKEIHVSENLGKFDSHNSISKNSYGLDWAIERSKEIPLILECYMHKLNENERLQQIKMILN